jgi:hypothetical protein
MYTDLSRGGILEEILAYIDDHTVLVELEDHTKFDSIESVKKEKERREENWRALADQEWGVRAPHTGWFFGDFNIPGSFLFAEAIVVTPFRAIMALLATVEQAQQALGETPWEKEWESFLASLTEGKAPKLGRLRLKFIVRLPGDITDIYNVSLGYGRTKLVPVFSDQRSSVIHWDDELAESEGWWEKEESKELDIGTLFPLGFGQHTASSFFYFDFLIDDPDFDPQGIVELSILSSEENKEEAVFVIDLSAMR